MTCGQAVSSPGAGMRFMCCLGSSRPTAPRQCWGSIQLKGQDGMGWDGRDGMGWDGAAAAPRRSPARWEETQPRWLHPAGPHLEKSVAGEQLHIPIRN